MGQGLEADLISNLADAQVWIEQQVLRFFNSYSRDIIREIQPGRFFKQLTKVKAARVHGLGDFGERKVLCLIFLNELLCPRHNRQLRVLLLKHELVADRRKMLAKY